MRNCLTSEGIKHFKVRATLDLGCRPKSTATRDTLPPTPEVEKGLPPSQSVSL